MKSEIATWEQKLVDSDELNKEEPMYTYIYIHTIEACGSDAVRVFIELNFFWKNQMEAVVFQIRLPNLVSFGRRPILGLKETGDGYPSKSNQLYVSSNGNAGHHQTPRRTRKNEPSLKKKTHKNVEDLKKPKSKNQEEIIALFRKIQTSISKESTSNNDDDDSNKDEHGAESIMETLLQSRNQIKGKKPTKRTGVEVLRRKGTSEEKERNHHTLPDADFKLARPPSNFVKRSPIPSSTGANGLHNRVEASQSIPESMALKFPSVDNMKLTELKALAKCRGIKGYSKLKKNELLEILRS